MHQTTHKPLFRALYINALYSVPVVNSTFDPKITQVLRGPLSTDFANIFKSDGHLLYTQEPAVLCVFWAVHGLTAGMMLNNEKEVLFTKS